LGHWHEGSLLIQAGGVTALDFGVKAIFKALQRFQ